MKNDKPSNIVEQLKSYFLNIKSFAIVVLIYLMISAFANFLDSSKVIWDWGTLVLSQFQEKQLSDGDLIEQAAALAKEISRYVADRNIDRPGTDFQNFDESVTKQLAHSSETLGYYYTDFQPRVAQYRAEFRKRGLTNEDVERFYEFPTNPIGIQMVANGLVDLVSQLRIKTN